MKPTEQTLGDVWRGEATRANRNPTVKYVVGWMVEFKEPRYEDRGFFRSPKLVEPATVTQDHTREFDSETLAVHFARTLAVSPGVNYVYVTKVTTSAPKREGIEFK